MVEYSVESISPGRKSGRMEMFDDRNEAMRYAKEQVEMGKGVAVDKHTENGQTMVAQKNMQVTGLGKGKSGQIFTKDFGRIAVSKKKPQGGFGNMDFSLKW